MSMSNASGVTFPPPPYGADETDVSTPPCSWYCQRVCGVGFQHVAQVVGAGHPEQLFPTGASLDCGASVHCGASVDCGASFGAASVVVPESGEDVLVPHATSSIKHANAFIDTGYTSGDA